MPIAILAGCGLSSLDPEPDRVTPDKAWNGEDVEVGIYGRDFHPLVEVGAGDATDVGVNAGFSVFLVPANKGDGNRYPLRQVTLVDFEEIDATVPSGTPLGVYDLVVASPSGREGRIPSAFTVTPTRADRFELDPSALSLRATDTATIRVQVLDTSGSPEFTGLPVTVTAVAVEDVDLASFARFEEGSLVGQAPRLVTDGIGLLGQLRADGSALVELSLDAPATVLFTVAPAELETAVDEATLRLEWKAGEDQHIDIGVPSSPVVAGSPFDVDVALVDQFGNEVDDPDTDVSVLLFDVCGDWQMQLEDFSGRLTVPAVLTTMSTASSCEHRIVAWGIPALEGESEIVEVVPGPAHHLDVQVSEVEVVAGQTLITTVRAVDAWGNPAEWSGGGASVAIDDTIASSSAYGCDDGSLFVTCTVRPIVASNGIRLEVHTHDLLSGLSPAFDVVPAAPASVDVAVTTGGTESAGTPFPVSLSMFDAFGNQVVTDTIVQDDIEVSDPLSEVGCGPLVGSSGSLSLDCTLFTATDDTWLQVVYHEAHGRSDSFEVVNGALAQVTVAVSSTSLVAGDFAVLTFSAFDAWDNPFVVGALRDLDISDTLGTTTPTKVPVGGLGTVVSAFKVTVSGTTRFVASQLGVEFGRSTSIDIEPGDATRLAIGLDVPWVWVGETVDGTVRAIDAYGNLSTWEGTATVTSSNGDVDVDVDVVKGLGRFQSEWTDPDVSDRLYGEAEGLFGLSGTVVVVEECGTEGPTLAIGYGGHDTAIACHDGDTAEIAASLAGSSASNGSLAVYGLAVGSAVHVSSTSDVTVEVATPGMLPLRAMVAQIDGCAVQTTDTAWIAPDDGSPAGPIDVSVGGSLTAGGAATTSILIEDVVDCSRDPAAGQAVLVRTDLGAVGGATATGWGLSLTLDSNGDASATLSASSAHTGGTATVTAWASSESALGSDTTTVTGDNQRPTVWAMDPSGDVSDDIETITLAFSEDLLATSVGASVFSVSGPTSVSVSSASLSGSTVTLGLSDVLDGTAGTWTVTASADLRDSAGNRLSGDWSGGAASFAGVFGDVPTAVGAVTSCVPDTAEFRPDGDDGSGGEADYANLTLATGTTGAWWIAEVYSADNTWIRQEHMAATSTTATWTWDGRDAAGRVVANGTYAIVVDIDDGNGNRGGACETSVSVANGTGS